MAVPDSERLGLPELGRNEHLSDAEAKRIVVRGLNPDDGLFYNVSVVESTSTPGVYGLVVLSSTGADISGGGAAADGAFDDMAGNDLEFMDGNSMDFMSG
jgi:hypothetical protein